MSLKTAMSSRIIDIRIIYIIMYYALNYKGIPTTHSLSVCMSVSPPLSLSLYPYIYYYIQQYVHIQSNSCLGLWLKKRCFWTSWGSAMDNGQFPVLGYIRGNPLKGTQIWNTRSKTKRIPLLWGYVTIVNWCTVLHTPRKRVSALIL